ncbi:hypothetical protein E2542_SST10423 [Spatholobus suberectus]|nr:hypothetical protein E2542_SST10423 [Spatholobus suberectus]
MVGFVDIRRTISLSQFSPTPLRSVDLNVCLGLTKCHKLEQRCIHFVAKIAKSHSLIGSSTTRTKQLAESSCFLSASLQETWWPEQFFYEGILFCQSRLVGIFYVVNSLRRQFWKSSAVVFLL